MSRLQLEAATHLPEVDVEARLATVRVVAEIFGWLGMLYGFIHLKQDRTWNWGFT